MTRAARSLVSETFLAFELWLTIAVIYLAVNLVMSQLGAFLERRIGGAAA